MAALYDGSLDSNPKSSTPYTDPDRRKYTSPVFGWSPYADEEPVFSNVVLTICRSVEIS